MIKNKYNLKYTRRLYKSRIRPQQKKNRILHKKIYRYKIRLQHKELIYKIKIR